MKTGVTLTDDTGRAWTVGRTLERGAWSASWLVRDSGGHEAVLKVPLGADVLGEDAPEAAACMDELAGMLRRGGIPWLPRLQASLRTPDGRPALLTSWHGPSLEARMRDGLRLAEVVRRLAAVARALEASSPQGRAHGHLMADHIRFDDKGRPILDDPLTPRGARLAVKLGAVRPHLPPEAADVLEPTWDTWSLCTILYRAAMAGPQGDPDLLPPSTGLDKIALATVKDRALERLKHEGANPRFVARVAERLGALLNRGLSPDAQPSPPYRFAHVSALRPRLEELDDLLHPHIESVGRLLLAPSATSGVYTGGEHVEFSVSVGASQGVGDAEDIVTGIRLVDLDDADKRRVQAGESRFTVKAHPSGRLRFDFALLDVPPGRYGIEVAFAIKDSGAEPATASNQFEVRPPPGWVPPAPEPEAPRAVSLDEARRQREARPVPAPTPIPTPIPRSSQTPPLGEAAYIFPQPVAPSTPGVLEEEVNPPTRVPESGGMPTAVPPSTVLASEADAPATTPSVQIPTPTPAPRPAPEADEPTVPTADLPPTPGPGQWEELPGPEPGIPLPTEDLLPPTGQEDLPMTEDLQRPSLLDRLPPQVRGVVEAVLKDTYTAVMAGVGGLLVVLVIFFILLRACS